MTKGKRIKRKKLPRASDNGILHELHPARMMGSTLGVRACVSESVFDISQGSLRTGFLRGSHGEELLARGQDLGLLGFSGQMLPLFHYHSQPTDAYKTF